MTNEVKIILGISAAALVLFVGAAFFLGDTSKNTEKNVAVSDAERLVRPDSDHTASNSAAITLVEFGDYQCPACGVVHPVVKKVIEDYGVNVNFVFRNFPLPAHKNAVVSAEAAEAAGAQGKFWEMHNMLYETQADWESSNTPLDIFAGYAKKLGLNVGEFRTFVENKKGEEKINRDKDDGIVLGVNATPTFYINGQKLTLDRLPTVQDFKERFDPLLKNK